MSDEPQGVASGADPGEGRDRCVAIGCSVTVPTGREWCRQHWAMVPKRLQTRLYHSTGIERQRVLAEARAAVEAAEFGPRLL